MAVQNVFPTLRILDYDRARAFWVDGLGFRVDWEWRHEPGFPVFMQVSRDGMALYLSEHSGDCQVGGLVHLYVADVDGFREEIEGRDVEIVSEPTDQPWGNRDMVLLDPFGNRICIATVLVRSSPRT